MAWRPHGRAKASPSNPRAWGVCDRCNLLYNHNKLSWQFDWAGPQLINKRILVCQTCMDAPQQQLRTFALPPDPVPIQNPRPEQYQSDFVTYLLTQAGDNLVTQSELKIITQNSVPPPESN
jgi:hypothetical protein